jgi:hypothetical protein
MMAHLAKALAILLILGIDTVPADSQKLVKANY